MPTNPEDVLQPWNWNIPLDGFLWLVFIIIAAVVFLAASQGRDRKGLPNQLGRDVEDFAGVVQEANGPLTRFLLIFYLVVAIGIVGYAMITLSQGYNY